MSYCSPYGPFFTVANIFPSRIQRNTVFRDTPSLFAASLASMRFPLPFFAYIIPLLQQNCNNNKKIKSGTDRFIYVIFSIFLIAGEVPLHRV
jgi:hypothetical protein